MRMSVKRSSYKILVVGAGLAGCASARLLAERGHEVTVIDQRAHVGGNCYDFKDKSGITVHRYGPHIFHTSDSSVVDFVRRFADFRTYEHRVLSSVGNELYPFPLNLDSLNRFYDKDMNEAEAQKFIQDEISKAGLPSSPTNYREAVIAQVGPKLYEAFYENYTRKQWQREPDELDASLAGRIPLRFNRDDRYFTDTFQGIPMNGYTAMCVEMLRHPAIKVNLSTMFRRKMLPSFDKLVYTGRLDSYLAYAYGELSYRSVRLEFETLPVPHFQEAAVINYPNEHEYTRITEYKKISGEEASHTVISKEYPDTQGFAAYIVPEPSMLERREKYIRLARSFEKSGKIVFIGRLAEYKYYNMDQVIAESLRRFGD